MPNKYCIRVTANYLASPYDDSLTDTKSPSLDMNRGRSSELPAAAMQHTVYNSSHRSSDYEKDSPS